MEISNIYTDLSLVPTSVLEAIYLHRLYEELAVPFDMYIKRYTCLHINDSVYCDGKDWRLQFYQNKEQLTKIRMMVIPDVVVMDNKIIKNRYGKHD